MSKRDYYEVLGVEKGADQKEIKRPIAVWRKNSTLIETRTIPPQRKNSAKCRKLTKF
ncbi:hypothetical protein HAALTHF_04160n [Vreelandella aquamarina]|nr:hypothetical protein HAALTHF_04160n [Halomonas axialensis]